MTIKNTIPGCTCNHGHTPGFPNLGGYARCPVHDPNMQEPVDLSPDFGKEISHKERIKQAAKKFANGSGTWESCKTHAYIAGEEIEYDYWQPILSKKDADIRELVEALEDIAKDISDGLYNSAYAVASHLINKHQKK